MPTTQTITLIDPFEHHGATVATVQIREPSGGLFAKLGDPRIAVRKSDGGYWVEQTEVIGQYFDKCIVHQDGSTLLSLMSMSDVMQIKETLFGFFVDAESKIIAMRAASSSSTRSA